MALGDALRGGVTLTKGEAAETVSHVHEVVGRMKWNYLRPAYTALGWCTYTSDDLPMGAFYVIRDEKRIVVGKTTWNLLSFDPQSKYSVLQALREGAGGVKLLPVDSGPLLDAVRAQLGAESPDADVVRIDRLADMEERAKKIVLEAASLNDINPGDGVSPVLAQVFAVRFIELMEEWTALQEQVARIGAIVEMAVDAIN